MESNENGDGPSSTDTQFYWNLTKHIFRYSHFKDSDAYNGAHTVNEGEHHSSPVFKQASIIICPAVRAESVIEEIRFITTFILNWDEASV